MMGTLPGSISSTTAVDRARALLTPVARLSSASQAGSGHGYIDLLGDRDPTSTGVSQNLMLSRALPVVYERWWRPAMGQLAKGLFGPGMDDEHTIALEMLRVGTGDTVLDLACGPGNFTRRFASSVGEPGLVLGVDASATMLARAAQDTHAANVVYLRADATDLPLHDASVDAACCFAALNLFAHPMLALDEMRRALRPGGRIALFTSCRRGPAPLAALAGPFEKLAGMTMFGRDELVDALAARGFDDVSQRVSGVTQFVGGRRSPGSHGDATRPGSVA
jgi:SAM-dependent methyltransferase